MATPKMPDTQPHPSNPPADPPPMERPRQPTQPERNEPRATTPDRAQPGPQQATTESSGGCCGNDKPM